MAIDIGAIFFSGIRTFALVRWISITSVGFEPQISQISLKYDLSRFDHTLHYYIPVSFTIDSFLNLEQIYS